MEEFIDILEETPFWVYLILILVIITGMKSTKHRTIPYKQIFILPTILTIWSVNILFSRWEGHIGDLIYWIFAIGLGSVIGWLIARKKKLVVDRERKTLTLPGTRSVLILGLLFFSFRYGFGVYYATHSDISHQFTIADFIISGFLTGTLVGRALHFWRLYEHSI